MRYENTGATESSEDYLEAILVIRAERGFCRNADIAERLGVTRPSVTKALAGLSSRSLVEVAGRDVRLTPEGRRLAGATLEKHEFFRRLLCDAGVDGGRRQRRRAAWSTASPTPPSAAWRTTSRAYGGRAGDRPGAREPGQSALNPAAHAASTAGGMRRFRPPGDPRAGDDTIPSGDDGNGPSLVFGGQGGLPPAGKGRLLRAITPLPGRPPRSLSRAPSSPCASGRTHPC